LIAFLLLWEAIPHFGLVNPAFLPGPSVLPAAFWREVTSGACFRRSSARSAIISPG
jgi:sulfonate transport system permease protein